MIKRILLGAAVAIGGLVVATPQADAAIVYRVAPVRRMAARAVLPPYPVARRAFVAPVIGPYSYVYPAYRPVVYGPAWYGPGVSVSVY